MGRFYGTDGMIYLFTNRSYGAPFLDAAGRFARTTGTPITVVLSGHRRRDRANGAVGGLRALAKRWRGFRDAAAAGLPVMHVDDVNAPSFIASIEPGDHAVMAGFDQIFKAPAIAQFTSFVNVHPSLLPFYRGPEPAYWCLDNGERVTGFTIHTVTTKIDWGEIHDQQMLAIDPSEDPGVLTSRIAALAVPSFVRWLEHLRSAEPWSKRVVDAAALYRTHVDYKSFRPAGLVQRNV